jgi:hypothetical protein
MIIQFRTGFNTYESLDLDEKQITSLLNHFLVDTCSNEAILNSFKTKGYLDEDYVSDFRYRSHLEK